ncbi:unnamed protein product [Protopolystoma xenopodis]|uniref:Uncharacterized protein n=1 Tax=Protopolystoma xenopodis TaxID=117903 RepID=A0A3S5FEX7_9PLAT|nr:unnamed protein product [Protopolystoma xenopodis]
METKAIWLKMVVFDDKRDTGITTIVNRPAPACTVSILFLSLTPSHCHGSTPAGGVDKTQTRRGEVETAAHSSRDESDFW